MKEDRRYRVIKALRNGGASASSFDGREDAMAFACKAVAEDGRTAFAAVKDEASGKPALVFLDDDGEGNASPRAIEDLARDICIIKEKGRVSRILLDGAPHDDALAARENPDVELFVEYDFWKNGFIGFRRFKGVPAIVRLEM